MALRVLRLRIVPTFAPKSCHGRHYSSIHASLYNAQELITVSSAPTTSFLPSQCFTAGRGHYVSYNLLNTKSFSSGSSEESTNKPSNTDTDQSNNDGLPELLYEGPFASLTLRLKRISLMSAVIGIVGLPALSVFYGGGSIPATGQLAIIATAGVTAVGSTALLGYCFSPYVHYLERLPPATLNENNVDEGEEDQNLFRITTRDILARRVETIFNPATDISPAPSNNSRPFCNFMVRGLPMYVHKEMIHDHKLRVQLVGEEEPQQQDDLEAKNKKKTDDDEFF